ncbi:MAG: DUF6498-containing protein [Parcubacteria group bacterium]
MVKKNGSSLSALFLLILVNLIPLFGVLYLDWGVVTILVLYWMESVVIGYFGYKKIFKVTGNRPKKHFFGLLFGLLGPASYFLFNFIVFILVDALFLVILLVIFLLQTPTSFIEYDLSFSYLIIGFIGFWISHWYSYRSNFLGREEYLKYTPKSVTRAPYKRIWVMHAFIIVAGGIMAWTWSLVSLLLVLVVLKIVADITLHLMEHNFYRNNKEQ